MNQQKSPRLSREDCHAYVAEQIFQLRPSHYGTSYPNWPGQVGLEVEMLPLYPQNAALPQTVSFAHTDLNLTALLEQTASQHNWQLVRDSDSQLKLVQLDDNDMLTFEPGGQLEFSTRPYPCLSDTVKRVRSVQEILDRSFQTAQVTLLQTGINPWHTTAEIGLQMAKPRYRAMHQYFSSHNLFGAKMMRQTCTIQVCLDFGSDETTLVRRFLAAQYLAPYAAAVFAFSPYVDRHLTSKKTYRSHVWSQMERERTGFPDLEEIQRTAKKDACVESYLAYALAAPVVFITANAYQQPQPWLTFDAWLEQDYQGFFPTLDDFMTHLSLLFPEVRPKGFLELRSVDCQSRVWQVVPAAFFTGLLYDEDNTSWILDHLAGSRDDLIAKMGKAQMGLTEMDIRTTAKILAEKAMAGFSRLPACFRGQGSEQALRNFFDCFTFQGLTPADALLAKTQAQNLSFPSLTVYRELEAEWAKQG